ncbi:DNA-binding FrmR family transcriptional regulator [Hydrogenivirga caldilitoris]|uniref:DNA-binding FrmR family transcriptional regulator n=1 Tax=Hydrogenivirga caldilitoris TaxID=246264 RepID=A0A497XUC2_9AQUI|nr:metal-sensitive transcriptional regulator [Hydrogenivirga caldilitoris]RLJ70742.1 DNA-binding FrmR family transcriptional regulator [Hydrogenivirga caldilitoris]
MKGCDVYLSEESVKELTSRLSKIEGQIRGIQRMIQEKRSCDEILIQISAVKSALNGVATKLLEDHVQSCVKPSVEAGDLKALEDFLEAVKKLIKGGC